MLDEVLLSNSALLFWNKDLGICLSPPVFTFRLIKIPNCQSVLISVTVLGPVLALVLSPYERRSWWCVSLFRHNRQQASHAESVGLRVVTWRSAQQGERPQPSNSRERRRFRSDPGPICPVCPLQVVVYVPGSKGAPSFVRLYQYPVLGGPTAALANKSFFKADRVTMQWNKKGRTQDLLWSWSWSWKYSSFI